MPNIKSQSDAIFLKIGNKIVAITIDVKPLKNKK